MLDLDPARPHRPIRCEAAFGLGEHSGIEICKPDLDITVPIDLGTARYDKFNAFNRNGVIREGRYGTLNLDLPFAPAISVVPVTLVVDLDEERDELAPLTGAELDLDECPDLDVSRTCGAFDLRVRGHREGHAPDRDRSVGDRFHAALHFVRGIIVRPGNVSPPRHNGDRHPPIGRPLRGNQHVRTEVEVVHRCRSAEPRLDGRLTADGKRRLVHRNGGGTDGRDFPDEPYASVPLCEDLQSRRASVGSALGDYEDAATDEAARAGITVHLRYGDEGELVPADGNGCCRCGLDKAVNPERIGRSREITDNESRPGPVLGAECILYGDAQVPNGSPPVQLRHGGACREGSVLPDGQYAFVPVAFPCRLDLDLALGHGGEIQTGAGHDFDVDDVRLTEEPVVRRIIRAGRHEQAVLRRYRGGCRRRHDDGQEQLERFLALSDGGI